MMQSHAVFGFTTGGNEVTTALIAIVAGFVMELVAFLYPTFYWRKGWYTGDKEAPKWIGRLLFGGIGALFILVGFKQLVYGY